MATSDLQPEETRNSPFGGTKVPVEYQGYILTSASRWGISPAILAAQINAESSFNPRAVSPAGALGIAQFLPGTAKAMGVDPWNPQSAIDGMARYDAENFKKFGSIEMMLAAYHDGPAGASDGKISAAGQNYVKKIIAAAGSDLGIIGAAFTGDVGGDPLKNLTGIVDRLQDPGFWKRNGIAALGIGVALVGGYFMLEKQGFNVVKKVESVL